ncbi:MBL fold metallo-hydrolase [Leifsonia sp. fls2-241-R2A-40a]|uniref:MBL fold metallo-hydrolase n=1 Tax=Leifsonia sp. fls2-241-R2A-40a TaxID=3040290 RepID=UPI00254C4210|nr:MBL fold metallo-hydrolase [Leifsonia sp. fls2-241-R2A-40a]
MRELIDSVHRLDGARGANAYLIEAADRSVVVDTGVASGGQRLVAELRAARIPAITDVVITHYDPDHIGSAAAVQRETGATVWLGAADARILRGEVPPPTRTRRVMRRMSRPDRAEQPQLTELSDDSETEIVPGLLVVPAPGHTPGHHLVRWRGVAFIGDAALVSKGRLRHLPGPLISDRGQADATLAAITALRPRLVLPGHGRAGRLD